MKRFFLFGKLLTSLSGPPHSETQPTMETQRERMAPKALKAASKFKSVDNFSRWWHLTSIKL